MCTNKPIRAHSIQNSHVLDLLVSEGHVVSPQLSFTGGTLKIEFKKAGRHSASTFTGFCSEHDRDIFREVDAPEIDLANRTHLFLLAYRAVSRELHTVIDGAIKVQAAYIHRVQRGFDPEDTASPAGILATQHLMNAFETYEYRAANYDQPLISNSESNIVHDVIVIDNQAPTVAVSSLFSFDGIENGGQLVRCGLNVFPSSNEQTAVIFSYAEVDANLARNALTKVLSTSGPEQKHELSKLILDRTENFVISPRFYEKWGPEKVEKVVKAFAAGVDKGNDKGISLF